MIITPTQTRGQQVFKAEIINGLFTVTHCGEVYEQNPNWNFLQEAWERADELNEENGYE